MRRLLVCGIGTDVGKTVVSAILVQALGAHYWKPLQAGNLNCSDTQTIKHLVDDVQCCPEIYRLHNPLSPHHAAALEGIELDPQLFQLPNLSMNCSLVIESVGGVLVPLREGMLLIDIFSQWQCEWIIVSRHYLGSINHTLLTVEALQKRQLNLRGIIFNGSNQPATENLILSYTGLPCLGHLYPEPHFTSSIINRYACIWKSHL